jgi:hypothetical protein
MRKLFERAPRAVSEIPTRRNRENAGGLGENPLALTIPHVARLLDNFAGELSCFRSRIRLRQQEGRNPVVGQFE